MVREPSVDVERWREWLASRKVVVVTSPHPQDTVLEGLVEVPLTPRGTLDPVETGGILTKQVDLFDPNRVTVGRNQVDRAPSPRVRRTVTSPHLSRERSLRDGVLRPHRRRTHTGPIKDTDDFRTGSTRASERRIWYDRCNQE